MELDEEVDEEVGKPEHLHLGLMMVDFLCAQVRFLYTRNINHEHTLRFGLYVLDASLVDEVNLSTNTNVKFTCLKHNMFLLWRICFVHLHYLISNLPRPRNNRWINRSQNS